MSKEDGGPAFACADNLGHQEGMSLRDYFAAEVLPLLIEYYGHEDKHGAFARAAAGAYQAADAMLAERAKGGDK